MAVVAVERRGDSSDLPRDSFLPLSHSLSLRARCVLYFRFSAAAARHATVEKGARLASNNII